MAYKKDINQLKKDREKTTSKNNNPKINNWKKQTDNINWIIWKNTKTKERIILFKKSFGRTKKNRVLIEDASEYPYTITLNDKNFKTKSQALKYAKEYMRRN